MSSILDDIGYALRTPQRIGVCRQCKGCGFMVEGDAQHGMPINVRCSLCRGKRESAEKPSIRIGFETVDPQFKDRW